MEDKRELALRLRFAKENRIPLRLESAGGKTFTVLVLDITDHLAIYKFQNGNDGKIRLENILDCSFPDRRDTDRYGEWKTGLLYSVGNPRERAAHFRAYYEEILRKLQSKETEGSPEYQYYEFKIKTYEKMFDNLFKNSDNLLLKYFFGNRDDQNRDALEKKFILLLQQSNLSQKRAVEASLANKISLIEGPPGTGKTTTILSIIANMVCRRQKVLVVSKNNSAIDNVAEELDGMGLPCFYIRMGNDKVMTAAGAGLREKLKRDAKALAVRPAEITPEELQTIRTVFQQLSGMEEQLNRLVAVKNELEEFKNQLRHLEKRRRAYAYETEDRKIKRRVSSSVGAKRKLDLLAGLSVRLEEEGELGLFNRLALLFRCRERSQTFAEYGIYQILYLEERYLRLRIGELEAELEGQNMEQLKTQIRTLYLDNYIPLSEKLLLASLSQSLEGDRFSALDQAMEAVEAEHGTGVLMKTFKDRLTDLYPVVLTTVDSVLSNFYTALKNGTTVDCIIIDEASQCDILSALPLLYLAKRIVVVGDSKQLEAIKGLEPTETFRAVDADWDYLEHSFLTTISAVMKPVSNLLMEHYRCDYSIINYCNKYFYDNQLIIYRDTSGHAMGLVDNDKGKYVEQEKGSFYNSREIETIRQIIGEDGTRKFMITPFKQQAEQLKRLYDPKQCGTIHTFQGKGEKEVYFSTVLNDTEEARRHLAGDHNLFGKELINVAVSRAKDRFVMVTDVGFFKSRDANVTTLIEYMETYGERIPDKTVCLFDYLYRRMPAYQPAGNADNPFEETLQAFLQKYLEEQEHYEFRMKLPLAAVVTDETYLRENPEIKQFIRRHAHLDYTIYDKRVNRPALVIELDGKYHREEAQALRDEKKNAALRHMEIPLWRIGSKEAWTEEMLRERLESYLGSEEQ